MASQASHLCEFDYYVVVDFEATCEKDAQIFPQEVIEFPAVLVHGVTGELVSAFRTYVRPRHHPILTSLEVLGYLWITLPQRETFLMKELNDIWNSRTYIDTEVPGKLQVYSSIGPWEGFVYRHEIMDLDSSTHRNEAITSWKDSVVTSAHQVIGHCVVSKFAISSELKRQCRSSVQHMTMPNWK